jgi:hypothetical protein
MPQVGFEPTTPVFEWEKDGYEDVSLCLITHHAMKIYGKLISV